MTTLIALVKAAGLTVAIGLIILFALAAILLIVGMFAKPSNCQECYNYITGACACSDDEKQGCSLFVHLSDPP